MGAVHAGQGAANAKSYDLVLVHGLTNKYKWSDSFLDACLRAHGSGHVFVIYTTGSDRTWTRGIGGRTLMCAGEDSFGAGDAGISDQVAYMKSKIEILQSRYRLSKPFSIIGHSMGGLVSRQYAYQNPNMVADIVTLGTPHHGSQLAYDMEWAGLFIGASAAMRDLRPDFVDGSFNRMFPVKGIQFANDGKLYTIRGDSDGWDTCGAIPVVCELFVGYWWLKDVYGFDNDGMVPHYSGIIGGAVDLYQFWGYDHYHLISESAVAVKALSVLR